MQTNRNRLALPQGFRLANYELTRVLGKGGFGITYLGIDRHLGRKIAIKELMPDTIVTRVEGNMVAVQSEALASNWAWAKERFMEEARVLASFQHPNIVEVHQLIEANGTVYMVMDYIEGESYEARLRRIGREPDEHSMRLVLEPLLDGLEEVHAAGLLHRDIKPDNILMRRGIQPILLDFGSARKQLEGTAIMTSLVTHGYSPIEQYQVKGKQGPWTDIYALAAVAARGMIGEKPPMSADRITEDDFVWLSYRGLKDYNPRFLQAVDWGLRVVPKERPQNIAEWRTSFGWIAKDHSHSKQPAPAPEIITISSSAEKTLVATPKDELQAKSITRPLEPIPKTFPSAATRPGTGRVTKKSKQLTSSKPKLKKAVKRWTPLVPALIVFGVVVLSLFFLGGKNRPPVVVPSPTPDPVAIVKPKITAPRYTPYVNSLGMEFAPVAGADVRFCIWDTRVKDYRAFVQATGRDWKKPDFAQESDSPAVNVSWEDAKAFCAWLTTKEGVEYRLPTDEEWSLAVGLRGEPEGAPKDKDGKVKNVYPWGSSWPPPKDSGNYDHSMMSDSYEKTSPVGKFPPNRFGLYDISGNVWQWCDDWYDYNHRYRVLRGGAWNSCTPVILLSSFRYYAQPDEKCDNIGFRCVTTTHKPIKP